MDCEKCFHYWNNGKDEYCETRGWDFKRTDCPDFQDKSKPITKADRIRSMTDEELADWILSVQQDIVGYYACEKHVPELPVERNTWLDWLKQEATT